MQRKIVFCGVTAFILISLPLLIFSKSFQQKPNSIESKIHLKKGKTYQTIIECGKFHEAFSIKRFIVPAHHAVRIEWLNLEDYPALTTIEAESECRRKVSYKVVSRETYKVANRYSWRTTYRCQIVKVSRAKKDQSPRAN